MKTPTMTNFRLGLLLLLSVSVPSVAQEQSEPGPDCSRWDFKNLALGMSVAQVKEQYGAASPVGRKRDAARLGGHAYRWQHKDGAQLIDFRVLADDQGDGGTVMEIQAKIRGGGITPEQWHSALLEKWGGISELREDEPSVGQTTIHGRSVDDTCDARVEFHGTGDAEQMTLEITLVSIAATREWNRRQAEEANRNKARDLLE